eukprot:3592161-Amphidinium_carterae.1
MSLLQCLRYYRPTCRALIIYRFQPSTCQWLTSSGCIFVTLRAASATPLNLTSIVAYWDTYVKEEHDIPTLCSRIIA